MVKCDVSEFKNPPRDISRGPFTSVETRKLATEIDPGNSWTWKMSLTIKNGLPSGKLT